MARSWGNLKRKYILCPIVGTHTVQPGGSIKAIHCWQLGKKHLAVSCSFAVIAQSMQCHRVSLFLLALVYMVHAVPALQYKLLSEKRGGFVKVHSNGQVTADASRAGKCVLKHILLIVCAGGTGFPNNA